jgi:hypothetical protein
VVASHYQVDFEAVSSGYVVPVGVEDEVVMDCADALTATTTDMLTEDFTDFLFPDEGCTSTHLENLSMATSRWV